MKWTTRPPTAPGPVWVDPWYGTPTPAVLLDFRDDGTPLVAFPGSPGFDAVPPDQRNRWCPIPEPEESTPPKTGEDGEEATCNEP